MKLWDAIPPERPRSLAAYSIRVTRNTALKRLAYRQRGKRDARRDVLLSEVEDFLPAADDPARRAEAAETLALVERWLDALGPTERTLFVRRYFYLDAPESLARDFGMTPNAVSVRLCRLRADLKKVLEKEDVTL